MNARIKDLGNGLKSEAVATDTHMRYNPATGDVQVDFHFQTFVTLQDGTPVGDYTTGMYDVISQSLSALGPRKFGAGLVDPVSGVKLDFLSGAGVMLLMKAVTDVVYNERAAMLLTPVPVDVPVVPQAP